MAQPESTTKVIPDHEICGWLPGQRVCVTGGRGALGRRLVRRLAAAGAARVVALDSQPAGPQDRERGGDAVKQVVGSILDPGDLDEALSGCTVVFHLAALVHAGRSQLQPARFFEVNALGTARLLEACRRAGVERVVYTSTSHVYGVPQRLPVDEDHPTLPLSPYAASKLAGEIAVQGCAVGLGLSCDVARLANLYGASFTDDTVVGRALTQAAAGGPISLRSLVAVRDFVHAADVVEALVRLAATGHDEPGCRTVNVSTGHGVSVLEVADTLSKVAGESGMKRPEVSQAGQDGREQVPALVLDNRRLAELTGWVPETTIEQGLRLAWRELRGRGASSAAGASRR